MRFVADGYDADFIRDNLERDRDNFLTHLDEGQKIYRAIGDCAPAFGMVGTLIGMVQMFANMTDPSKLGPYMAVALLATFYGAAVANLFCLPIADKLHLKLVDEEINRTLIIDGILMIRDAKSPTLVREMLLAYLPEKHRHAEDEERSRDGGRAATHRSGSTMAKKKGGGHGGGHGWFVTFADLMGLLVALLRDAGRVLHPGSGQAADRRRLDARRLRRAEQRALFRHHRGRRPADAAEAQERRPIKPEEASATPSPDEQEPQPQLRRAARATTGAFALASASLRQALQDMPEITEMSKHIMIEETKQGLNIEIVDQDGRSMFPEGSKEPYERTRRLMQQLAAPLKAMPYRISITGHTAASKVPAKPGYGPWELSADRANAVRQILEGEGVPTGAYLHGGRQGRHPAAVPGRSLLAESPRHHHADARRAAAAGRFQALSRQIWLAALDPASICARETPVFSSAGAVL